MASDRISCEDSEIDQATLSASTSGNDLKVATNCANVLKPEDKLKVNNLRTLSQTPVTSRSTPFKCPLQHSSTENVPSGKFSLSSLLSLRSLLFFFPSALYTWCLSIFFPAISDEKENSYLYFNVVW